jgi:hypothetical protein
VKGKAYGLGKYKWHNGEEYEGQWENGLRQGKGLWKGNSEHNMYVGDWKNNRADGFGTYTWLNGI